MTQGIVLSDCADILEETLDRYGEQSTNGFRKILHLCISDMKKSHTSVDDMAIWEDALAFLARTDPIPGRGQLIERVVIYMRSQ